MTRLQRLQLRQSEARQRLGDLLDTDLETRSETHDADVRSLTAELRGLEVDLQAAILIDPEPTTETRTEDDDGESLELRELRERAELRGFLAAAASGNRVDGAEAEYRHAVLGDNADDTTMPLEMLIDPDDMERRADDATTISTAVPATQRSIAGRVYARSDSAYLGVRFVDVPVGEISWPYLTAGTSAGTYAESASVEADSATVTVASATPTRVSARYKFQIESAARISGLESALRSDLTSTLSDALDGQTINGNGTAPNVSGLLKRLTAPTAPSDTVTGLDLIGAFSDAVDGKLAVSANEVRMLVGVETYRVAGRLQLTSSGQLVRRVLETESPGRFRASSRIAVPTSDIQHAIAYRFSRDPGNAYMPTWGGVQIVRDPYTESSAGRVALTVHQLFSFAVKRLDGWSQLSYKTA